MLLDDTIVDQLLIKAVSTYLEKFIALHKVAREYALGNGALYGPWPVASWFPDDLVERSSYLSPVFRGLFPQLGDNIFYRGFVIYEPGTDSGLKVYQPFMPHHPEASLPSLNALNNPTIDWMTVKLEILLAKVTKITAELENNSRVVRARQLDLYHGYRQK